MDLIKQYITQSITAASNNLRLTSQQIEVVALIRELIGKSADLENDLKKMKRVTEFSKLAIRLSEMYNYLSGRVDLLKISDQFKIHSSGLIKELTYFLDTVTPQDFKSATEKMKQIDKPSGSIPSEETAAKQENDIINVDLSKRSVSDELLISQTESIKEKLILEDDKPDDDLLFQNFEKTVLEPIKPLDAFLKKMNLDEINTAELDEFVKVMNKNGVLSDKRGFEILSNMHRIIARALTFIKLREVMPGKEVINSLRACLIVIVAVVKGKEVDITSYLNKAEDFGKRLQMMKIKTESE